MEWDGWAGVGDAQYERRYLCRGTGWLGPGLPLAIHNGLPSLIPTPGKSPKPCFAPRPSVPMVGHAWQAGAQISSAVFLHPCSSPECSQSLVQTSPSEGFSGQGLLGAFLPKVVLQWCFFEGRE